MVRGSRPGSHLGFGLRGDANLSASGTATRRPESRYSGSGLGLCQSQCAPPVTATAANQEPAPVTRPCTPAIRDPPLTRGRALGLRVTCGFCRGPAAKRMRVLGDRSGTRGLGAGVASEGYYGPRRQARMLTLRPYCNTSSNRFQSPAFARPCPDEAEQTANGDPA